METLVPFPNTIVKHAAADGSAPPLVCESRSSPGLRTPVSARRSGSPHLRGSPAGRSQASDRLASHVQAAGCRAYPFAELRAAGSGARSGCPRHAVSSRTPRWLRRSGCQSRADAGCSDLIPVSVQLRPARSPKLCLEAAALMRLPSMALSSLAAGSEVRSGSPAVPAE